LLASFAVLDTDEFMKMDGSPVLDPDQLVIHDSSSLSITTLSRTPGKTALKHTETWNTPINAELENAVPQLGRLKREACFRHYGPARWARQVLGTHQVLFQSQFSSAVTKI
jgi:hypothetical protein